MEYELNGVPLLKTRKTLRKGFLDFRVKLSKRPWLQYLLKVMFGFLILLHGFLSFAILTSSKSPDRFEIALIPLICLCIELILLNCFVLSVLVSDVLKKKVGFTVAERNSLGRLLRNTFSALMWLASFVLAIIYIETDQKRVLFHSLGIMTLPLDVLYVLGLIRYLILKSNNAFWWLSHIGLCLAEITLLNLKADAQFRLNWLLVVTPLVLGCLQLGCYFVFRPEKGLKVLVKLLGFLGCLLGALSLVCLGLHLENVANSFELFKVLGWVFLVLGGLGYCEELGVFVLDILVGHVEKTQSSPVQPNPVLRTRSFPDFKSKI